MRESNPNTYVSDLLNTTDLLTAGSILKEIDAFLSESRTGRAALCKELSRALMESSLAFTSWVLLSKTGYTIYRPSVTVPIYLWMHGLVTTGAVRDTIPRVKELLRHINDSFTTPSGNCLTEERAEYVLQVLRKKFPYFEIVSRHEALRIFFLNNSHKLYNSEFGMGTDAGQFFVFMYHMKDSELSPEYVFLHELGHVLQASLTGSVDVVPEEFLCFDQAVGGQLKQGDPDASEVFADLFAIAVMRGTVLCSYDPFPFSDEFKCNIERFIFKLFQKYQA